MKSWGALIKEDLLTKQTSRLQENFPGDFLFFRSLIQGKRSFSFLSWAEAGLDHNREALTDEHAKSSQRN